MKIKELYHIRPAMNEVRVGMQHKSLDTPSFPKSNLRSYPAMTIGKHLQTYIKITKVLNACIIILIFSSESSLLRSVHQPLAPLHGGMKCY